MQPLPPTKRALLLDLSVLAVLVGAGVWMRLYWGLGAHGVYHPDEIYQALEPAHRLIYGFGLQSWEWEFGARNWSLPAMLAGVLGAARVVGLDQPESYIAVMRVFISCLFSATAFAVYLLARHFKASRILAVAAAAIFLFNPVTIALGFRTLSEVISTPFVLFGLVGALGAGSLGQTDELNPRARRWLVIGVSLLSIAVLFRLQNAVFALCIVLPWRFQAAQRARYELAMKVLVGWALVYGAIDWISWGVPFASAGAYIRFNLLMDGAAAYFGTSPAYYYLQTFYSSMGLLGVALLVLPLLAVTRARALLVCTVIFLGMHSVFSHKEFRFVLTTIPLFALLSAVGLQWAIDQNKRAKLRRALGFAIPAALLAATSWGVGQVSRLTMGDMGAPDLPNIPSNTRVFDIFAPVNLLLIAASERDDICGLYLPEYMAVETGGHTYFHRNTPFFHEKNRPAEKANYNYAIAAQKMQPEWVFIEAKQSFSLYRTQLQNCTPAAGYDTALFPEQPDV